MKARNLLLSFVGCCLAGAVLASCTDQGPTGSRFDPPSQPAAEKRDTTPLFTPLSVPIQSSDSTCIRGGYIGPDGRWVCR